MTKSKAFSLQNSANSWWDIGLSKFIPVFWPTVPGNEDLNATSTIPWQRQQSRNDIPSSTASRNPISDQHPNSFEKRDQNMLQLPFGPRCQKSVSPTIVERKCVTDSGSEYNEKNSEMYGFQHFIGHTGLSNNRLRETDGISPSSLYEDYIQPTGTSPSAKHARLDSNSYPGQSYYNSVLIAHGESSGQPETTDGPVTNRENPKGDSFFANHARLDENSYRGQSYHDSVPIAHGESSGQPETTIGSVVTPTLPTVGTGQQGVTNLHSHTTPQLASMQSTNGHWNSLEERRHAIKAAKFQNDRFFSFPENLYPWMHESENQSPVNVAKLVLSTLKRLPIGMHTFSEIRNYIARNCDVSIKAINEDIKDYLLFASEKEYIIKIGQRFGLPSRMDAYSRDP